MVSMVTQEEFQISTIVVWNGELEEVAPCPALNGVVLTSQAAQYHLMC